MDTRIEKTITSGELTDEAKEIIAKGIKNLAMFKKSNNAFIVTFLSIIISVYIFLWFDIGQSIFNNNEEDNPNNNYDTFNSDNRWSKMILYTFVFILIILLMNLLLFGIIFMSILIYNDNSFSESLDIFIENFWNINDLSKYYLGYAFILFGLFTIFVIYSKITKYFDTIAYESSEDPTTDKTLLRKYIINYASYILLMLIFILFIINQDVTKGYIINIALLLFYIIIIICVNQNQLFKQQYKTFIYLLVVFIVYVCYIFLI